MAPELLLVSVADGVAVVTLDNPPLNLVSIEMTAALEGLLDAFAEDPAIRVLVLTGSGERAFCAGSDVTEFRTLTGPAEVLERKLIGENRAYSKLAAFPKPTIAAVQGVALGGGLELAVCCDLIVVEEGVKLGLPEIKLGWFPGSGGTVRVTRRIGEARAKEMMFFGEPIDAQTALRWGLVNRVVAHSQALATARGLAERLAVGPNLALQLCKRAIGASFDVTEEQAVGEALRLSDQAFRSADAKEGIRAFFAKEPPRFTHG